MKSQIEKWDNTAFPEFLRTLPEIDINQKGIRGWILQGGNRQAVFLDIQPIGEVPPHSHCAQWGIVVEGTMALTIEGVTKTYRKGDWYFIPEGAVHSARFESRVSAIDIFEAPDRYRARA